MSGSHLSCRRCPRRQRGEPSYPLKDRPVQPARHRDFGQLKRDVSGVMNHLRTDLDELVAQRRERPLLHTRRQRQPAQEVAQVVRQHMQLQPRLVGVEAVTAQTCPTDRVLALLDPLLGGAAAVFVQRSVAMTTSSIPALRRDLPPIQYDDHQIIDVHELVTVRIAGAER